MLSVLDEAYKIGMMNNGMLIDPPRPSATSSRPIAASGRSRSAAPKDCISTIWSATRAGKEADFVVLDCNGGPAALAWRQSLIAEGGKLSTIEQAADLLFGVMAVGDDRAIEQTCDGHAGVSAAMSPAVPAVILSSPLGEEDFWCAA